MILVQRLQTLIALVNKWDKTYQKVGNQVSEDPKFSEQKAQINTLRESLIDSVKQAHAQEEGEDNDFAKLDSLMKKMEAIRKNADAFLKTKDLSGGMIFMTRSQYDILDAFRSAYYTFDSTFQSSQQSTQDIFGQITNEYDQRVKKYHANFEAIIQRTGIMADEEITADEEEPTNNWEDTTDTNTTPEDTTTWQDTTTTIPEDTTWQDTTTEQSNTTDSTVIDTNSVEANPVQSSNTQVNGLVQLRDTITSAYNQANSIFTPAYNKAGGDLVVLTMPEHDAVYSFLNQYENFNFKFDKSNDSIQQEFESLTSNWAKQTKTLFDTIQKNITKVKITEQHTNRLSNPKPTINHNVVDTITGEDPKLGAIYQKMDRFVKNEDGRQFVKKKVTEDDLFKVGADDRDASGIDPYDIIQGALGNCYFMCSLSAIANSKGGPQKIKDMITANSDGTFTVKLYRPINVRSKDELHNNIKSSTVGFEAVDVVVEGDVWFSKTEDNALYARSQDEGEMWPLILEKAFAKLMGGYDEIDAGFSEEAYAVLTGTPRRSFEFSDNNEHAIKMILEAAEKKIGVTFATPPNMAANYALDENGNNLRGNAGELIMMTSKDDGEERIVAGHAYALDSISNGIVSLINPHGKNHIKKMPINSLQFYFSRVVVDF